MTRKMTTDILTQTGLTALADAGTSGNDVLQGSDQADRLAGLGGDDSLNGHAGNDTLLGGAGRDEIYGGAGDNTIFGGADSDRIHGDEFVLDFGPRLGGDDRIYGGDGNDMIEGGLGNDSSYGGDGNDMILDYGGLANSWGGRGDDLILGGEGTLRGDAGNDTVQGQTVFGGTGDDSVLGDSVASVLDAGLGNDTLTVLSQGNDRLTGGRGADVFVFFNSTRGVDRITDFRLGVDSLDLEDFGVTAANLASVASQVGRDVEINLATSDGLGLTVVLEKVSLSLLLA